DVCSSDLVVWTSSDSTVASVDSDGRVRGNSAGVATITATTADGNHTASSAITVTSAGSGTLANSDFDEGAEGWILYDWTSGGGNSLSVVQDAGMSGSNAAR